MLLTRLRTAITLAVFLSILSLAALEAGAQEFRQTVESLKEASDAVVIAKTLRSESFWNEDRTAILTRVFLQVEESITGSSPAQTEVIVPGGRIGGFIHEVSDMPSFFDDEESIVFIERHSSGVNVVAGGAIGKILIDKDPVTHVRTVTRPPFFLMEEDAQPSDAVKPSGAETGVTPVSDVPEKKSMTLDEFKKRIK